MTLWPPLVEVVNENAFSKYTNYRNSVLCRHSKMYSALEENSHSFTLNTNAWSTLKSLGTNYQLQLWQYRHT